jgi:hypothetical protein
MGEAAVNPRPRGLCRSDGNIQDYRIIVNYEWVF